MSSEIADAFLRLRRDRPNDPLIHLPADRATMSIAAVAELARVMVRSFDAAGVAPRAVVAAAIGNRPGAVAAFLACRLSDRTYLPLDAGTPAAEIGDVGHRFGAAAVISTAPQPIPHFGAAQPYPADLTLAVADRDPGDSRFGAAVVLKMTSGSTGLPRATLTTEPVLVHDSGTLMQAMGVGPDDVQVAAIPLSHAYGFGNLLVPALVQGSPLLMRDASCRSGSPRTPAHMAPASIPACRSCSITSPPTRLMAAGRRCSIG
jgi:acyl-CoA synthetase (AMP-forming)/AMP-acid ligase II